MSGPPKDQDGFITGPAQPSQNSTTPTFGAPKVNSPTDPAASLASRIGGFLPGYTPPNQQSSNGQPSTYAWAPPTAPREIRAPQSGNLNFGAPASGSGAFSAGGAAPTAPRAIRAPQSGNLNFGAPASGSGAFSAGGAAPTAPMAVRPPQSGGLTFGAPASGPGAFSAGGAVVNGSSATGFGASGSGAGGSGGVAPGAFSAGGSLANGSNTTGFGAGARSTSGLGGAAAGAFSAGQSVLNGPFGAGGRTASGSGGAAPQAASLSIRGAAVQQSATQTPAAPPVHEPVPPEEEQRDTSQLIKSTYEVQVTLADQQANVNSPLYSVKRFQDLGLAPELLEGITMMNFWRPSKIQERALPLLMQNPPRNFIGQSQSGTGKTAAFVLTMLSRVDFSRHSTQAVCLAPSRELARQIMDVVNKMGKYTKATTFAAIKQKAETGMMITPEVQTSAHIIVGTPGTFLDMVRKRRIDLMDTKVFVVDEADNMLEAQGLGDQTFRCRNALPKTGVQMVLFSATFPEEVRTFANKLAPNANRIELKKEELSVEGIKQFYMDCRDAEHKYEVLLDIYKVMIVGSSIIFTHSREEADNIAARMIADGHQVASLHGAKDPADRDRLMNEFRQGRRKVLITTNVIARGIDVPQVNVVVNYDLPRTRNNRPDPDTYLHRIGRTGRFGMTGTSINFVHDKKSWQEMLEIEKALGRPIVRINAGDIDTMEAELKTVWKAKTNADTAAALAVLADRPSAHANDPR